MPKSGVMRKRLSHKQASKKKRRPMGDMKATKKSHELKVRGTSTLKSKRFLGGYA